MPTGERVKSFGHADKGPHATSSGRSLHQYICLTLHQPLASLMVWGLKRVEGRGWDSDYRGRLFIHAAALEPSPDDIARYEAFYTDVFQLEFGRDAGAPQFPKHYPTSCLVGCVTVVDVVPKEEFAKWKSLPRSAKLEGDANGSGYYFLCQEQKRMVLPFQMSGQHKLWKLDRKVVERATKQLKACEQMPVDFQGHRDGLFPPRSEEEQGEHYDDEYEHLGGGAAAGTAAEEEEEEEEIAAAVSAASRAALALEEEESVALAMAMSLSMTDK